MTEKNWLSKILPNNLGVPGVSSQELENLSEKAKVFKERREAEMLKMRAFINEVKASLETILGKVSLGQEVKIWLENEKMFVLIERTAQDYRIRMCTTTNDKTTLRGYKPRREGVIQFQDISFNTKSNIGTINIHHWDEESTAKLLESAGFTWSTASEIEIGDVDTLSYDELEKLYNSVSRIIRVPEQILTN